MVLSDWMIQRNGQTTLQLNHPRQWEAEAKAVREVIYTAQAHREPDGLEQALEKHDLHRTIRTICLDPEVHK